MQNHVLLLAPPTTWAQPIHDFLANLTRSGAPKPTRTLRSYHLRRFAVDCGTDPWSVTIHDLNAHIDRHTWAPSTRKTFRSTMREFYRWAIDHEHTDRNPADRLTRIRVPAGIPRPADDDAYEAALTNADDRTRLMLRLAASGLRCREIAAVHSDDVARVPRGWFIRVHGKGDRIRHVPIPEDLALELATIDGLAFPGRVDGHLSAHYVSKLLSRALPPAVTAHQLRHRFGTRAYQLGGRDIRAVQELLGHASVATTQIYTQVEAESLWTAALAAA